MLWSCCRSSRVCLRDFFRTVLYGFTIPPKSLLLVQNDQYVESEQVIVQIRVGRYTLNLKERVRKHIYFDPDGEMFNPSVRLIEKGDNTWENSEWVLTHCFSFCLHVHVHLYFGLETCLG